jgi:hypothetical protein
MSAEIPKVTEDQRVLLARDSGAGFATIERCVAQLMSEGFGAAAIERDNYYYADLAARDDGMLEFNGFGMKALAKAEYVKKFEGWIAKFVFYAIETSVLGKTVIGDPVCAVEVDSEGLVRIGDDSNRYTVFPRIPGMATGAIYNRLKQTLLCVAENRHE